MDKEYKKYIFIKTDYLKQKHKIDLERVIFVEYFDRIGNLEWPEQKNALISTRIYPTFAAWSAAEDNKYGNFFTS